MAEHSMSAPKALNGWRPRPRASLLLCMIGIVYGIVVFVGFFSIFIPQIGGGWLSQILTVILYPLQFLVPSQTTSFWPILIIPLYLALPEIVISLLLFRLRATWMAIIIVVWTVLSSLAFIGMFLLLAIGFAFFFG